MCSILQYEKRNLLSSDVFFMTGLDKKILSSLFINKPKTVSYLSFLEKEQKLCCVFQLCQNWKNINFNVKLILGGLKQKKKLFWLNLREHCTFIFLGFVVKLISNNHVLCSFFQREKLDASLWTFLCLFWLYFMPCLYWKLHMMRHWELFTFHSASDRSASVRFWSRSEPFHVIRGVGVQPSIQLSESYFLVKNFLRKDTVIFVSALWERFYNFCFGFGNKTNNLY